VARGVLDYAPMTRLAIAAVLLAASTSVASAGSYLGIGIGTSADGSVGASETVEGAGRSGRLMVGTRFGRLALEGQGSRFDMMFASSSYETTQLGLGLKVSVPLGNNFELFGRGGVQRTWLNLDGDSTMYDSAGNGWFLGAGIEYRLNLGVTGASIFLDYQGSSSTLTNDRMQEIDGSTGMWTLGATVSL
jgi:hypothetical protein